MNIILCGFPGSGKTFFGQLISKKLNYPFIDIDSSIENLYAECTSKKFSCREIFQEGEKTFRFYEYQVISSLVSYQNTVIALGGGSLKQEENIKILKSMGIIFYLKTPLHLLLQRMAQKEQIPGYLDINDPIRSFECLYQERLESYERIADVHIETHHLTVDDIITSIRNCYQKKVENHYGK